MVILRLSILFMLTRTCSCQGSMDSTPACSFDALPVNDTFDVSLAKQFTATKEKCYELCLRDDTCTYLEFRDDLCLIYHASSSADMDPRRVDSTDSVYEMTRNNSMAKPCRRIEFELTRSPPQTAGTTTDSNDGNATIVHTNWNTEPKHLCFEVFLESKTADEAKEHCENIGGLLASIHTQEQNNLIHEKSYHTRTWIGLRFTEKVGTRTREKYWIDNSAIDFENWDHKEPNNLGGEYCTVINADGTWNDINCERKFSVACQIESASPCQNE